MTIAHDDVLSPSENTSNAELLTTSGEFFATVTALFSTLNEVRGPNATAMTAVEALGDLTKMASEVLTMIKPFVATLVTQRQKDSALAAQALPCRIENLQASLSAAIRDAAALHGTFLREIKAFK